MQFATAHTNHSIFIPRDSGSPKDGLFAHISTLGQLARLDFEKFGVAGEVIFKVEGDAAPTAQEDEEARIGSLAYASKKLGNATDAAEFVRCLNAICEGGDARYRQTAASHYYREIAQCGVAVVLKEMALLAMQLEQFNQTNETLVEERIFDVFGTDNGACQSADSTEEFTAVRSLFEEEIEAVARMLRGRRKGAKFSQDDFAAMIDELDTSGASVEELDAAFESLAAIEQYDESGAIIMMSSYERTAACGRLDPEYTAEDLPERARHLAGELRCAYASGVKIEELWDDLDAQLEVLFPVKGKTASGASFYSYANRELQGLSREILAALLADCQEDFHLTALRTNKAYRRFHKTVRTAQDTGQISEQMKQAYAARQSGELPLKHFTALNTAARLQRTRLESAPLSKPATQLLHEIEGASTGKLRFLRWAMYGDNQPQHTIHQLPAQERAHLWNVLKTRPSAQSAAAV